MDISKLSSQTLWNDRIKVGCETFSFSPVCMYWDRHLMTRHMLLFSFPWGPCLIQYKDQLFNSFLFPLAHCVASYSFAAKSALTTKLMLLSTTFCKLYITKCRVKTCVTSDPGSLKIDLPQNICILSTEWHKNARWADSKACKLRRYL